MNNLLDIKTPAQAQAAGAARAITAWRHLGLTNLQQVYWNLPTEALYEEIVFRGEGAHHASGPARRQHRQAHRRARPTTSSSCAKRHPRTTSGGASTTARSSPRSSTSCTTACRAILQGRDVFVQDCYAGADPQYRLPIRIITEHGLAQPVRPQHVHPARAPTRSTGGTCRSSPSSAVPVVQGHPADRRHALRARSSCSTSRRSCASSATRPTPARSRSRSSRS